MLILDFVVQHVEGMIFSGYNINGNRGEIHIYEALSLKPKQMGGTK
jgi:hypothetical protein